MLTAFSLPFPHAPRETQRAGSEALNGPSNLHNYDVSTKNLVTILFAPSSPCAMLVASESVGVIETFSSRNVVGDIVNQMFIVMCSILPFGRKSLHKSTAGNRATWQLVRTGCSNGNSSFFQ